MIRRRSALERQIDGDLRMGDRVVIRSEPVDSHIAVASGATMIIGDDVEIDGGAGFACGVRIEIGDRCRFGPFVQLLDTDFHVAGDDDAAPEPLPILIGDDVQIGAWTIVLPGTTIGSGAVVRAGSVVSGAVASGAVVSGNPARVERDREDSDLSVDDLVAEAVADVLELSERPGLDARPQTLPGWSSLAALRLLVTLEERLGRRLDEAAFVQAVDLAELAAVVRDAA